MEKRLSATSSVRELSGLRNHVANWLLLDGNRMLLAGGLSLGVFLWVRTLIYVEILAVGPGSSAATLFASGLTSGTITLVTIALSINQLILSRVFGSPNELTDQLSGTRELREQIEQLAGQPSTPNDPAEFLSLLARTLREHVLALQATIRESGWDAPDEVDEYLRALGKYGENIDERIQDQTAIVNVLAVVLGTGYARNMTATHRFRNGYTDSLPEDARREAEAIHDLLEAIAVTRQFFKTLALQQDFARLSRTVASSGLVALVATITLTLVYQSNGVTIDPRFLPFVVSFGIAVISIPLTVFIAFILRAATIARWTVSVGPFVPSQERSDGS